MVFYITSRVEAMAALVSEQAMLFQDVLVVVTQALKITDIHTKVRDQILQILRSDFIKGRNFRFTMTLEMIGCSPLQYQKSVKQRRVLSRA